VRIVSHDATRRNNDEQAGWTRVSRPHHLASPWAG